MDTGKYIQGKRVWVAAWREWGMTYCFIDRPPTPEGTVPLGALFFGQISDEPHRPAELTPQLPAGRGPPFRGPC